MKLSEIIQTFGPAMEMKYGDKLLPSHKKAMAAIEKCRTEQCGKIFVKCPDCGKVESFFHPCGHRGCPNCQNHETTKWIEKQRQKLLPVQYFLITVTVPYELRKVIWNNQKECYSTLFSSSASAMSEIAKNKQYLGGEIGMTGVLHTHARNLDFHPHIHFIVPGGAIDKRKKLWKKKRGKYILPNYTESETGETKYRRMRGEDFLFLVLQHILPKGFRRTRDFGFLHGNTKKTLQLLQLVIQVKTKENKETETPKFRCSKCGSNMNIIFHTFDRKSFIAMNKSTKNLSK